VVDESFTAAG
jgi:alkanesulfonate monooxygenase SsuD/methylene tetrahydromethanopterin reductase-like flavin-dependent oxidoreductase (luciferase family)